MIAMDDIDSGKVYGDVILVDDAMSMEQKWDTSKITIDLITDDIDTEDLIADTE